MSNSPDPMVIERVELRHLRLPLLKPFETSFARETHKDAVLVTCYSGEHEGWGEVVAMESPVYNEETIETAWHVLRDFLVPLTLNRAWEHPAQWAEAAQPIRRNFMAKAGLESALWDLLSHRTGHPLAELFGPGGSAEVETGISLGLEVDPAVTLAQVGEAVAAGYPRVKLKIKPGSDVDLVTRVRAAFPDLQLQVDANSAYRLSDLPVFEALDELNLTMIEQPLDCDDIVDHARLQARLRTPICLDESIDTPQRARQALEIGACRVINIKPGRMGGYVHALETHDLCLEEGVPVWCGGMLETGIGRLHNLALASRPGFILPGDLSPSARYFATDIIDPPVEMDEQGRLVVPREAGVAGRIDRTRLSQATQRYLQICNTTATSPT